MVNDAVGGIIICKEIVVLKKKLTPVPLYLPQIPCSWPED
jgi:hypothetical protein